MFIKCKKFIIDYKSFLCMSTIYVNVLLISPFYIFFSISIGVFINMLDSNISKKKLRMLRVLVAVLKAEGGYFEKSKI